ncbi:cytochrome P450 [Kitasatospora viridis]|uniref:Cholest-4-en-3-one 26-monooxygenase n=1 Tax=Kitasatospora viridis TaxID=281105 RepID=A0A561SFS1_9ACTN|nr:cytochrome P450 [Kitasatospora viridis]TWF73647.1 cholest-4-en-3-one 26-monooxygenase [Kitasatospora viridis]
MTSHTVPTGIDVFDPDRYVPTPPHHDFAVLRAQAPVYWQTDPQLPTGHWAVTRHADVSWIARKPELFSSELAGAQPMEYDEVAIGMQRMMMINQDAPQHSRVRSLVNRGFTPRMIEQLRDRIAAECERIVDEALRTGGGDFVQQVAAELPIVVIAELMGVPRDQRHKLFAWSKGVAGEADPDSGGARAARVAAQEMGQYAAVLGAERRGCPAGDIVSRMVSADAQGNELTESEFQAFFVLLAVAGNETTRYAIAGGVQALMAHPEQWARLKADPSLVTTAAEEIVRWETPTKVFRRTAVTDVELGGQLIRAGDKVMAHLTSANRDEEVFDDPFTFDVGRDPNPHLGFGGGGPHFCIGRHLALLEVELMFRTLVERVAEFQPAGPARRLRSYQFHGLTHLPVRLVAA